MEDVLSHPVISSFLSKYDSKDHINCLQALSLIGISSLHGKSYPPESLYKISLRLAGSPALPSHQTLKSNKKQARQHSLKSRHSLRNLQKTRKIKQKKIDNKTKSDWNLKLYGSAKLFQKVNQQEESNVNKPDKRPYKQIKQISTKASGNHNF